MVTRPVVGSCGATGQSMPCHGVMPTIH
jgi:hypothetical protein